MTNSWEGQQNVFPKWRKLDGVPNGKQTTIKTKRFMIEGIGKKQVNTEKELEDIVIIKGKHS